MKENKKNNSKSKIYIPSKNIKVSEINGKTIYRLSYRTKSQKSQEVIIPEIYLTKTKTGYLMSSAEFSTFLAITKIKGRVNWDELTKYFSKVGKDPNETK